MVVWFEKENITPIQTTTGNHFHNFDMSLIIARLLILKLDRFALVYVGNYMGD